MKVLVPNDFIDYELLDSGEEYRLEKFGKFIISRPDPQAIWKKKYSAKKWQKIDAQYIRVNENQGHWKFAKRMPERWPVHYKQLSFYAKLTSFKHTGIFPEQSVHWDWIQTKIKDTKRPVHILNLFGYTGIASIAAAQAGAKVTHVDASRSSIGWAKDNQKLTKLDESSIRWILDDALKFCQRELKRGVKYDGIIMDPPIYGHGPKGEIWKFNESFPKLLEVCSKILSKHPLFFIVNAYAISASSIMLHNLFLDFLPQDGLIEYGELALQEEDQGRLLSTGIFARWSTTT